MAKVEKEHVLRMSFPDPGKLPPPVLMLQNLSFAYPGSPLLYDGVDFGVDLDSRIALVGPNGKGKTTLLKMLTGELVPSTGAVRPHPHLRIARYTQHAADALDLKLTPLEYFIELLPELQISEVRKKLGRYGVSGPMQVTKMAYLSTGCKSRVVFAKLALRTPHLLLLDEPVRLPEARGRNVRGGRRGRRGAGERQGWMPCLSRCAHSLHSIARALSSRPVCRRTAWTWRRSTRWPAPSTSLAAASCSSATTSACCRRS